MGFLYLMLEQLGKDCSNLVEIITPGKSKRIE